MIKTRVVGNNGQGLNVSDGGTLNVAIQQYPGIDDTVSVLPFRQYFTDNGVNTGSKNMNVDGSTTYTDFYVSASEIYDIYIKYITVEIGDSGTPALNKFGALTELSNGVSFYWSTNEEPAYELHEGIKTNKEFIRIASDTAAIGTGVDSYLADVSGGGTEKSYLPSIDMAEIYGLSWGLRLKKGSLDKLIFRIQDNLTGLITFNAIATGTRI